MVIAVPLEKVNSCKSFLAKLSEKCVVKCVVVCSEIRNIGGQNRLNCAPTRTRTWNPLIKSQLLYQLSHGRIRLKNPLNPTSITYLVAVDSKLVDYLAGVAEAPLLGYCLFV